MNPLAVHPALWSARWTDELGALAVEHAAALGYSHVVVPLREPLQINPARTSQIFSQVSLSPVNTANQLTDADLSSVDPQIRRRGQDRLRLSIRLARDMGSSQINGVIYGPLCKAEAPASPASRDACAESLATLADEAKVAGVRLALEVVNRYESNMLNTAEQAVALIKQTGSDNLFVHLDTFHMNIEETDMITALRCARPYLAYFELDQNHRGDFLDGHIPLRPLLDELMESGYGGMIGVEAFSSSILSPETARALAIWRPVFDDGDRLAATAAGMVRQAYDRVNKASEGKPTA